MPRKTRRLFKDYELGFVRLAKMAGKILRQPNPPVPGIDQLPFGSANEPPESGPSPSGQGIACVC